MNLRIILSLIAMMLVSNFAFANVHTGIEVKLHAVKINVKNDENIYVKVSLKNRTSENISILKWYLPNQYNELEEGIFKIARDGESIPYLGRHYKRPAPISDDYLVLKANQSMNFKVELSGVYDFSEEGFYSIDFSVANLALFSHKMNGRSHSAASRMIADNVAEIYVQKVTSRKGKPCNPRKEDCGGDPDPGTDPDVSFTGSCSNSEQTTLLSALDAAKTMTNDSVSYLNGNSSTRYTTWFGTYSSARWNKVSGNFDAIKDGLDNKPKTLDCSCNQRYFAYVYPNEPYKIYLCKAFWSASLTGTDSKGGTLIHEMSHFNAVAGTDDVVYGQSGAQNLANSDPDSAITNADSHEYFAENTPNLN